MQTTLRIDDEIYRAAKAQAVSRARRSPASSSRPCATAFARTAVTPEARERDRLMEALLKRTARFRVGPRPTREETNAR
ncbi:MAG: hypothetical protein HS113_24110 [Verrucomicrobiales bacterium]|nr:hypothetical protein [Verrucomicrobiales bacterium]